MFDTPVLLMVFNRPETTVKVFERVRAVQPQRLFIAADGPRRNNDKDATQCAEVREIVSRIDWPCEVKTLFRQQNLGCGKAVSSAISWFFDHVDAGIILEDDTVPVNSFFSFCEKMLRRYEADTEIAHINGSNFLLGKSLVKESYYLSAYPMVWGWATWKRAWKNYEFDMNSYTQQKSIDSFWDMLGTKKEKEYWRRIFGIMEDGFTTGQKKIDTWDYQWIYTCWKNKQYSITPSHNLITNIGFGDGATHTLGQSLVSYLPGLELDAVIHPVNLSVHHRADRILFRNYFSPPPTFINRIRNIAYKVVPESMIDLYRAAKKAIFF